VKLITEFRRDVLGSWLDWKTFRQDRRRLLRRPGLAGKPVQRLKNRPLQFALHGLLPAVALAWLVETLAVAFLSLPPTPRERLIAQLDSLAAQYDSRGQAMLAQGNSILEDVPEWSAALDSVTLARESDRLKSRLSVLERLAGDDRLNSRVDSLRVRGDAALALAREGRRRDDLLLYLELHDSLMAAMEQQVQVLKFESAIYDSLTSLSESGIGWTRRDAGLDAMAGARHFARESRRSAAAIRAESLIARFSTLLVVVVLLSNAVAFSLILGKWYPTAGQNGANLYLYLVGAWLVWPNALYVAAEFVRELGDRYQLSGAWAVAGLQGIAFAWALWSLSQASKMIATVLLEREAKLVLEATHARVFVTALVSQTATAVVLSAAIEGLTALYVSSV
jgi:hypothetical protein